MTAFLDDFLIRAAVAGLIIALVSGPLGCFVLWRRMAYFGDATAHAALLGVVIALVAQLPIVLGILIATIGFAVLITAMSDRAYASDTLLGVFSYTALATAITALSLMPNAQSNIMGFLFGSILTVSKGDLAIIAPVAALILAVLIWRWQRLVSTTLSPELANSFDINPRLETLIFTLLLAVLIAISLKTVGALLIGALLIIPASAARVITGSPEAMAIAASLIAMASVGIGISGSLAFATPTGPSIVLGAAVFFIVFNLAGRLFLARR